MMKFAFSSALLLVIGSTSAEQVGVLLVDFILSLCW
jgi:hypothetical protein